MKRKAMQRLHTRMVKVASRPSTGAVARDRATGISLPLLPAKACLLAKRAWPTKGRARRAMPAAPVAEDLLAAKTRENMAVLMFEGLKDQISRVVNSFSSCKRPPQVV